MPEAIWNQSTASYKGFSGDDTVDAARLSPFGEEVNEAIRRHAAEAYPNEACGIIVDGAYVRSVNVHPNPQDFFEIDPALANVYNGRIQGVAHSHTKVMPWPTKLDMEQQDLMDVPWAIATVTCDGQNPPFCMDLFWFGDCLPRLPLLQRAFRPGIQDCFELARHYYMDEGYQIPVMPREAEWWIGPNKKNLFVDLLDASGFEIIKADDIRPGDGFSCAYGTEVICHCGVLLEHEKVLHHLAGEHSTIGAAYRWVKRTVDAGKFFRVKETMR